MQVITFTTTKQTATEYTENGRVQCISCAPSKMEEPKDGKEELTEYEKAEIVLKRSPLTRVKLLIAYSGGIPTTKMGEKRVNKTKKELIKEIKEAIKTTTHPDLQRHKLEATDYGETYWTCKSNWSINNYVEMLGIDKKKKVRGRVPMTKDELIAQYLMCAHHQEYEMLAIEYDCLIAA